MAHTNSVEIVEVGPRDGFQSVGPFIPTATKVALIKALHAAGVRRMEHASFVSPSAVPQMADAEAVVAATANLPGFDGAALVPNVRHAARALTAGAKHLSFFLSVSERHNQGNVRCTPRESVDEYRQIVAMMPQGTRVRVNVATSFDCPYQGRTESAAVLALLEHLIAVNDDAEIALCDTTGKGHPAQVRALFTAAQSRFTPRRGWAFHCHDTYGMGCANVVAAYDAGVRVFDAAVAGLGGCPFAPGATGNVATEDVVWMFEAMGVATGIDLTALTAVAHEVAALPGAQVGGRVRNALAASAKRAK
jgi:hydroxymethylglutaryl-CoA lyase